MHTDHSDVDYFIVHNFQWPHQLGVEELYNKSLVELLGL